MTLKELAQELINQVSGPKHQITLDDSTLGTTGVDELIRSSLGREAGNVILQATAADIPPDPPPTGFSFPCLLPASADDSFLKLLSNNCAITFTQKDSGAIEFYLEVNLFSANGQAKKWVFSDSFALLGDFVYDKIDFTSPFFVFATDGVTIAKGAFERGLSFTSPLTLKGPYAVVDALLQAAHVTPRLGSMSGLITGAEKPSFDLKASLGIDSISLILVSLHKSEIGAVYKIDQKKADGEDGADITSFIYLSGVVPLANSAGTEVNLRTTTFLDPTSKELSMRVSILPDGPFDTSLAQIGSLVGGQAWDTFFSGPSSVLLQFLKNFGLKSYTLSFTINPLAISLSDMVIGTLQPWVIQENKLVMNFFDVDWLLISPTSNPINQLTLLGELQMFGENNFIFDARIEIPDLRITASFKGEVTFSLVEWFNIVIQKFGMAPLPPDVVEALGSFTLREIYFSIQVGAAPSLSFNCAGSMNVGDKEVGFQVRMFIQGTAKESGDVSYSYTIGGAITLGGSLFEGVFKKTADDAVFTLQWTDTPNPIGLDTIAASLGYGDLGIPPELDLNLTQLGFSYNFTKKQLVVGAASENYGKADLIVFKPEGGAKFIFFGGLKVEKPIDLTNLPLVGQALSALERVEIRDLQVEISSDKISGKDATQLNSLVENLGLGYATIPAEGMASTVNLSMEFDIGKYVVPIGVGAGGKSATDLPADKSSVQGTPGGNTAAAVPSTPGDQSNGTTWFNAQKAVGPVMFRRIGVRYQESVLWFVLDASFSAGGLTIDLIGMAVGSPLSSFEPQFTLDGLGIDFRQPGLEIAGAFTKIKPSEGVDWEFAGGVVIRAGNFSISALGSYASLSGTPSMFIFGQVTGTFGGPPAFLVTGLAAGFGYNSNLRVPALNEVYQFPLVAGAQDPAVIGGSAATPAEVLAILLGSGGSKPWVTHQIGQYWLAVGVQFSSFQLVSTNALLVVEFGNHLLIAIIGLSRARFPMAGPVTYAFIELQIMVLLDITEGLFALSAVLSPNSYLLDPSCKLMGGFAFYTWFDPSQHAGDFVITIGGYHPSFDPPDWYPQVPKVGFTWSLDSKVSITGAAYFALTPSAIMAGGQLSVVFQDGDLKAWLTAWANMLIYWNPFHFAIDIGVSIGASYRLNLGFTTLTLEIELGASVKLWGPKTGGTATIHWYVISFTIAFGAKETPDPPPLQWPQFQNQLPPPDDMVKVVPGDGLAANGSADLNGGDPWVVRPARFQFSTSSAVPNSVLKLGKDGNVFKQGDPVNIRPMQQQGLASEQTLVITRGVSLNSEEVHEVQFEADGWTIAPRNQNVAKALWGTGPQNQIDQGDDQLVTDQLVGFDVLSPLPSLGSSPGQIKVAQNINYNLLSPTGTLPVQPDESPQGPLAQTSANSIAVIEQTIADVTYAGARTNLFASLKGLGVDPITNGDMTKYSQAAGTLFTDEPLIIPAP